MVTSARGSGGRGPAGRHEACGEFSGVTLRRLRRSVGFTAAELARRAGTSPRSIARFESGATRSPSFRLVVAVTHALNPELARRGRPMVALDDWSVSR